MNVAIDGAQRMRVEIRTSRLAACVGKSCGGGLRP